VSAAVMPGRACLAHPAHAEVVPIQVHRMRPLARGGQASPTVRLCANAHALVHDLLDELEETALTVPYATVHEVVRYLPPKVWADFPAEVRAIAYSGWKAYGLGFLNGRYVVHHHYWRTDGTPKEPEVPAFADLVHAARWSRRWRKELGRL
jgi:hypothetical protein